MLAAKLAQQPSKLKLVEFPTTEILSVRCTCKGHHADGGCTHTVFSTEVGMNTALCPDCWQGHCPRGNKSKSKNKT